MNRKIWLQTNTAAFLFFACGQILNGLPVALLTEGPKEVLKSYLDACDKEDLNAVKGCFSPAKDSLAALVDAYAQRRVACRRLVRIACQKLNAKGSELPPMLEMQSDEVTQGILTALQSAQVDISQSTAVVHLRSAKKECISENVVFKKADDGKWKISLTDMFHLDPSVSEERLKQLAQADKEKAALANKVADDIVSGKLTTIADAIRVLNAEYIKILGREAPVDLTPPSVAKRPVPKPTKEFPNVTVLR